MAITLAAATSSTAPIAPVRAGDGRTVARDVQRITLGSIAGAVIAGSTAAFFHRTAIATRAGAVAGAIGGALAGAGTLNFASSDALRFGLIAAGTGGALAAAIMPGLHGMPVSPRAAAFEVGIAGAALGGIAGGIIDLT